MKNVREIFLKGKSLLKHLPFSALEARLLLYKSAGISEKQFYADPDMPLQAEIEEYFFQLVAKRRSGYPLAYLLEHKEFWSMPFQVGSGVLIPRPETELIIEKVRAASSGREEVIVDLGTGCGNIAVVLARELPQALIIATDISQQALKFAHLNALRHNAGRISFLHGSLFSPLKKIKLENGCHFLVSNPPYISSRDWENLPQEIKEHEPKRALVAGETGLEFIQDLISGAGKFVKSGGYLVFEIGYDQKTRVASLFGKEWYKIECYPDLSGIPRVIKAQKK